MSGWIVRRGVVAILTLVFLSAAGVGIASATEADRDYWVGRWNELRAKQQEVSSALETARIDYRRGRRSNRGRGQERVELLTRIEQLEAELGAVEKTLAAFPDEAHRAGALPGWFREG